MNKIKEIKRLLDDKLNGYEVIVITILFLVSVLGTISLVREKISQKYLVEKPIYGGILNEGIVGNITNANPFFPNTQTDKDVAKLLYAPFSDFVYKTEISEDYTTYDFYINDAATFHDSSAISYQDIALSFDLFKKSKGSNLSDSLKDIKISNNEKNKITFKLTSKGEKDLSEKLNFPIIKSSEYKNIEDIESFIKNSKVSMGLVGSGAFYIKSINKKDNDNVEKITLLRFNSKIPKQSYIKSIVLNFYTSEDQALKDFTDGKINLITGIHSKAVEEVSKGKNTKLNKTELTTNFAIFINQKNNESLKSRDFREYLNGSINRKKIISDIFNDFAKEIDTLNGEVQNYNNAELLEKLQKAGFIFENGVLYRSTEQIKKSDAEKKQIEISLTTINNPELKKTAEAIKEDWSKIGIKVNISLIEKSEIASSLKDKNFDMFLFGLNISDKKSYYSFFHSSQTSYPKLNIAGYANKKVDSLTEKLLEDGVDLETQIASVKELSSEIQKERPVLLLYKPFFSTIYRTDKLNLIFANQIKDNEDRYLNIVDWFIYKEKTFPILKNNSFIKKMEMYIY